MHGSTRNIYVSSYIYLATYRVIGDRGGGVEDAVAAGEGLDKASWIQSADRRGGGRCDRRRRQGPSGGRSLDRLIESYVRCTKGPKDNMHASLVTLYICKLNRFVDIYHIYI